MLDEHGSPAPDSSLAAHGAADVSPDGPASDGLHDVPVHVLVVSHGAYIRVVIRHLVEDLNCALPPGVKMSQLFSPCPNTGISRFVLSLTRTDSGPALSAARCVFANRRRHLENLPDDEQSQGK